MTTVGSKGIIYNFFLLLHQRCTHVFSSSTCKGCMTCPPFVWLSSRVVAEINVIFLISNFRLVLNVVCFLLGDSPRL
jgi:hypothetical protein